MPRVIDLEKLVEKRIRELLSTGYEVLEGKDKADVLKIAIDWLKVQKRAEGGFGQAFTEANNFEENNG